MRAEPSVRTRARAQAQWQFDRFTLGRSNTDSLDRGRPCRVPEEMTMRIGAALSQPLRMLMVGVCILTTPVAGAQQLQTGSVRQTRVVLLGTGNPAADPDRSGPATAIVVNDTPYLV